MYRRTGQDFADCLAVDLFFVEDFVAGRAVLLTVFLAVAFLIVVLDSGIAVRFAGAFRAVVFFAAVLAFALTGFLAAGFALFGAVGFLAVVLRADGFAAAFALARAGLLDAGFAFVDFEVFFAARSLAFLSLANSLS